MHADPRSVLGLPPTASSREIRRAFRRLVLELHPDRHGGDPTRAARLRAVVDAYEALSSGSSRRPRRARTTRRSAPPPPAPRARFRYACPRCTDTFEHDAECPRCDVALVDELRAGPVTPIDDPRIDRMVADIERRAIARARTDRWMQRAPIAAISSLLAGGAAVLPVHLPIASMLIGYALYLVGAEVLAPRTPG